MVFTDSPNRQSHRVDKDLIAGSSAFLLARLTPQLLSCFFSHVLTENTPMLSVFRNKKIRIETLYNNSLTVDNTLNILILWEQRLIFRFWENTHALEWHGASGAAAMTPLSVNDPSTTVRIIDSGN